MLSFHVIIDEYHVYENKVIREFQTNIYQSKEEAKKCILEERKNKQRSIIKLEQNAFTYNYMYNEE
jgi:hypothetical protein